MIKVYKSKHSIWATHSVTTWLPLSIHVSNIGYGLPPPDYSGLWHVIMLSSLSNIVLFIYFKAQYKSTHYYGKIYFPTSIILSLVAITDKGNTISKITTGKIRLEREEDNDW